MAVQCDAREMSGKRRRGRPRTRWLDNVMLGEMSGKRR